jgi:hypothetical protein
VKSILLGRHALGLTLSAFAGSLLALLFRSAGPSDADHAYVPHQHIASLNSSSEAEWVCAYVKKDGDPGYDYGGASAGREVEVSASGLYCVPLILREPQDERDGGQVVFNTAT